MIVKILGIALVASAPAVIGFRRAARVHSRLRQAEDLTRFVEEMKRGIFYRGLPAQELIRALSQECRAGALEGFYDKVDHGYAPLTAWQEEKEEIESGCREILDDFFTGLGTTCRDGQEEIFQQTETRLLKRQAELEKEEKEKGRLYRSLGLLASAFLSILLI